MSTVIDLREQSSWLENLIPMVYQMVKDRRIDVKKLLVENPEAVEGIAERIISLRNETGDQNAFLPKEVIPTEVQEAILGAVDSKDIQWKIAMRNAIRSLLPPEDAALAHAASIMETAAEARKFPPERRGELFAASQEAKSLEIQQKSEDLKKQLEFEDALREFGVSPRTLAETKAQELELYRRQLANDLRQQDLRGLAYNYVIDMIDNLTGAELSLLALGNVEGGNYLAQLILSRTYRPDVSAVAQIENPRDLLLERMRQEAFLYQQIDDNLKLLEAAKGDEAKMQLYTNRINQLSKALLTINPRAKVPKIDLTKGIIGWGYKLSSTDALEVNRSRYNLLAGRLAMEGITSSGRAQLREALAYMHNGEVPKEIYDYIVNKAAEISSGGDLRRFQEAAQLAVLIRNETKGSDQVAKLNKRLDELNKKFNSTISKKGASLKEIEDIEREIMAIQMILMEIQDEW